MKMVGHTKASSRSETGQLGVFETGDVTLRFMARFRAAKWSEPVYLYILSCCA